MGLSMVKVMVFKEILDRCRGKRFHRTFELTSDRDIIQETEEKKQTCARKMPVMQ